MKIGMKLISSFAIVAVLVAVVGSIGAYGLNKTGNATDIILDQKVPIMDAAMESMISLISGRDIMGEFLLSEDVATLDETQKEFEQTVVAFDETNGYVKKNASEEIRNLANQADEFHSKFEENAVKMMSEHRLLLTAKADAAKIMGDFDTHVYDLKKLLVDYEVELTKVQKIDEKVDAAMEAKTLLVEQQAIAEEYMSVDSLEESAKLRTAFQEKLKEFDKLEKLLPQKITTEHDDFVKLALGKDGLFDHKDEEVALHTVTMEHMALVDEYSNKSDLLMDKVEESASKDMQAAMQVADAAQSTSKTMIISFTLLSFVAALIFGFFIGRGISVPLTKSVDMITEMEKGHLGMRLNIDRSDEIGTMAKTLNRFADNLKDEVVTILNHLAEGDLTFKASPKDVEDMIGNALKKTGDDLNRIVGEILAATEQIAAGAGQVSDASQSLSQGATESAAALEQITSSMTEMGSQTTTNAENASQANQLSSQAKHAAETGNEQMQNMVSAMGEINDAGQSISKIIKVIDEIAFQTNLLALNAAVEAARAGRHGKGFAVVAEEVRNLAARSAKAAKETAELIEGSVAKTKNGTDIANKTAESLAEIVSAVTKVTDLVGEIASASNEQAEGISQVNSGLGQIDQVTQQNTASAEEGAAAAEELSSQAMHLKALMNTFKVKGSSTKSIPRQALPHQASNTAHTEGWGDSPVKSPKPSEVIALDDSEFGKF
nr:HAMP domain-containing protein [Desulfobulbaceae bacterium]